jgi:hypothetical protein
MHRRIAISTAALLLALTGSVWAGGVEITPHAGYRIDTSLGGYTLDGGEAFGLMLNIPTKWDNATVELFGSYQDTEYLDGSRLLGDMEQWVLQAGVRHMLGQPKKVRPYVLWTGGIMNLDPAGGRSDATRVALGLGGGAMVDASKRIAFRFEGRSLATFINGGGGLFCNTGGDGSCAVTVNSHSMWQLDFLVGLVIKTGN